jgi:hypothetical protein
MKPSLLKQLFYGSTASILLALAGCASVATSTYTAPRSGDLASVTFHVPPPSDKLFSLVSAPTIYLYKDDQCTPYESGNIIGHLTNEKFVSQTLEKTVEIPAGQRVYILFGHATSGLGSFHCNLMMSFIPEANKSYNSLFSVIPGKESILACTLSLSNSDSTEVASLKFHDVQCKS